MLCSRRPRSYGSTRIGAGTSLSSRLDGRGLRIARGPTDAPFHESTPYAPNSPYSASKAGSDHLVRAYHETYGLETTVTNCSNNYGPYQFPEKLIPLTLINILQGQAAAGIWRRPASARLAARVGSLRGDRARRCAAADPGEVYNIGGNSETTNIEVVRICVRSRTSLSAKTRSFAPPFRLAGVERRPGR